MWLVKSLIFSFFFCFLRHVSRSHFLTDRHNFAPKRVFSTKNVPFGISVISDYIQGSNSQKQLPKWARIGISQPNRQSSKIAIYWSSMKIFASNFTDRFSTGGTIEKLQNYIKWNREGVT